MNLKTLGQLNDPIHNLFGESGTYPGHLGDQYTSLGTQILASKKDFSFSQQ